MRATQITIEGKKYWITYALSVEMALEERGLKMKDLSANPSATLYVALMAEMLKAGARWAKRTGEQYIDPPDEKDLADMIDTNTLKDLMVQMADVIRGERHVVAKPAKGKKDSAGASGG